MNEKEKWTQRAQEAFDAMTQETRESLEEVARSFCEDEEEIREMCVNQLARMMANADAYAAEFGTKESYERYIEEEFDRLVKLPEYSKDKAVPADALDKAVHARLISEHPAAARFSPPPAE
jgi:hypothetical protein